MHSKYQIFKLLLKFVFEYDDKGFFSEFKRINELLFPEKSSEKNLWFFEDLTGNKS